jgi:tetratricopeptide (TPR) repeat protein
VLTLGRAELLRGDYQRATALLQEGLSLAQELRDTWSMSLALINLGRLALHRGDHARAGSLFGDALTMGRDRGDKRVAAECLQGLAVVANAQGDAAGSARLHGAAEALLEAIGATPTPAEEAIRERFVPPVREALGEDAFGAEWAAGRALPTDEAISVALGVAGSRSTTERTGALAPS